MNVKVQLKSAGKHIRKTRKAGSTVQLGFSTIAEGTYSSDGQQEMRVRTNNKRKI